MAKQVVAADPNLAHLGRWAIPTLLQRWWARVSVALQRANVDAILASLGEEVGSRRQGLEEVYDVHELVVAQEPLTA